MPSQIIELPAAILETLYEQSGRLALRLGEAGFDMEIQEYPDSDITFALRSHPDFHDIGSRALTNDWILALVLIPTGGRPSCWPRPLADAATLRLIDVIESILVELDAVTAHQRIAVADALERARQATAIGLRPVSALPPRSSRQRRLHRLSVEASTRFAEPLRMLDRQLTSYQARLMESDLDSVIASLGCWSELGMKLRLRPRAADREADAALLAESRRGDLRDAIESASALAETTLAGLESFDPNATRFRTRITAEDLAWMNSCILGGPFNPRPKRFRGVAEGSASSDRTLECCSPVPPADIPRALDHWCVDMEAGHWTGIHSLVHATLAHLELLRIRPFTGGNGRLARLVLQILLRRAGWPTLPWELAFELLYDECQQAVRRACCKDDFPALMQVALRAGKLAIKLGTCIVNELAPVRDALVAAFPPENCTPIEARHHADGLLRALLVEGLPRLHRDHRNRVPIRALAEAAGVDRAWTPIGATYSVPAVRKLLARLPTEVGSMLDPAEA